MIMSILAIGIVAGIAYSWGSRGGFSSILNCFCVVLAGAIAFGAWEHVATYFIQAAGPRGISSYLGDVAWGAGLALPFGISLAVLRGIVDGTVRKNLKFGPTGDWVVGCAFGVISGIIVSGVTVQTISGMRVGNEALGYSAIVSDNGGNVQPGSGLILPTDRITNWIYSGLSRGTFASSTPMATWNPDPAAQLASTRFSFGEGKGRNSLKTADFEVLGRYVLDPAKMTPAVAPPKPANQGDASPPPAGDLNDLRSDLLDPGPQNVKMFDGETASKETRLHGVLVKFRAGAKERTSGQFIISNGQVYVIAEDDSGRPELFFPSAAICKAEAGKVAIARFRFDAKDTHLASLGGDSETNWAFEFFIPPQFEPRAIVIKGTRVRLDEDDAKFKPVVFENRMKRDALIAAGQLTSGQAGGQIDESRAIRLTASGTDPIPGVTVNNSIGVMLQDGTLGSGVTVVNGRITAGEFTINPKDAQGRGLDQALRVDKFAHPEQVGLMRIDVGSAQGENSLLGGAVRDAEAGTIPATPFVLDANGVKYDAVGYIYQDSSKFSIKYAIGEPIRSTNDIPRLSRSRPDQRMQLIFAPTVGVEIVGWGVGDKLVARYIPGVAIGSQR